MANSRALTRLGQVARGAGGAAGTSQGEQLDNVRLAQLEQQIARLPPGNPQRSLYERELSALKREMGPSSRPYMDKLERRSARAEDRRAEREAKEAELARQGALAPGAKTSNRGKESKVDPVAAPVDPREERFGHDMGWLDELFEEKPELLGESQRAGVYADPALVAKQNQALDQLFEVARMGGATAQERARRQNARDEEENWLRGQREADMMDLRERGMAGSGAEIAALNMDRQGAADRLSKAGLETDAWLEQRALDATMAGGDLAGKMRDTGFREGMERGTAADEFSILNNQALNQANAVNTQFKQKAWGDMIAARRREKEILLELGLDTASGLLGNDTDENAAGIKYAGDVAGKTASDANAGAVSHNNVVGDPTGTVGTTGAKGDINEALGGAITGTGGVIDSVASTALGAGGGGGVPTGGGGAAPAAGGYPQTGVSVPYDEDEVFG